MKIDFYTTDWCGDCVRSKALLKKFDLDFNEINVDLMKMQMNILRHYK